jgi:hypothetical protein
MCAGSISPSSGQREGSADADRRYRRRGFHDPTSPDMNAPFKSFAGS